MKWLALSWLAAGSAVTVVCLLQARACAARQRIADTYLEARINNRHAAEEARLAAQAELPDADPSWVILGWNREGAHLVMASQAVRVASFQQRRWVEQAEPVDFSAENPAGHVYAPHRRLRSRALNLTRRACDLSLEFPAYNLLHVKESRFDAAIAEVRKLWQPS